MQCLKIDFISEDTVHIRKNIALFMEILLALILAVGPFIFGSTTRTYIMYFIIVEHYM